MYYAHPRLVCLLCNILICSIMYVGKFYWLYILGFSKSPSSQSVCEGELARFQCQHPFATAIGWRVNGSYVGTGSRLPSNITLDRDDSDGRLDTLSIVGVSSYNGTEIECIAIFPNRSRIISPPAFLQGNDACTPTRNINFYYINQG